MGLWSVFIGQGGTQRTQTRVVNVRVSESFGHTEFEVIIDNPTVTERNQAKGRIDDAIIQITRGSDMLVGGFIEDVEFGGNYVTYSGRSFLILLGYSTASTTTSGGATEAEYENDTGADIIDDLITRYCITRDAEITKNITFTERYGGKVPLHGKKVYQIVREMCQMYGKDLWTDTTGTINDITAKNIHVGEKVRGTSTVEHKALYGGQHLKDIPIVKYRSSQTINCLRVIGGGSGKDKVSVWCEDLVSIAAIGSIEGEPYHNNMIRKIETAELIGAAIIEAKKDPIEELRVNLAMYISDLRYGDWVKIVDTHSNINTIKKIKKITRIYNINSADSMSIELGEKFDDYQNIIRDLTKGDVDSEPEMAMGGGSLCVTANDPPNTYVRIDGGKWYGSDGLLYERGNGVCVFWGGNPPYNATTVGNFFKALIQIADASGHAITYKTSLTSGAHTGYSKSYAINDDILTADDENTPLCEIICRCNNVSGTISNVTAIDEGGSYIFRDARPIVGSQAGGGGGGMWELTSAETWVTGITHTLRDFIGPTVDNTFSYECTVPGTTGAVEPTWSLILGNTTTDGGVTWACRKKGLKPIDIDGVTNLDIRIIPKGNGIVYLG